MHVLTHVIMSKFPFIESEPFFREKELHDQMEDIQFRLTVAEEDSLVASQSERECKAAKQE